MNKTTGNMVAQRSDAGSNPAPAFTFCHPSFKRPQQARACYDAWNDGQPMEWIVSLNDNDPTSGEYLTSFNGTTVMIIDSPARNMVQASNAAAKMANGDIIMLISDDMFPVGNWREAFTAAFAQHEGPAVLQVFDGIRSDILTLPIMNRAAYDALGYLYHPAYISMFADNDLMETAKARGFYKYHPEVRVEHRHYTNGKAVLDDTYLHENSMPAWKHGERLFNERKRHGFT